MRKKIIIDRAKRGIYFELIVRHFVCVGVSVHLTHDYSHTQNAIVIHFGINVLHSFNLSSKSWPSG